MHCVRTAARNKISAFSSFFKRCPEKPSGYFPDPRIDEQYRMRSIGEDAEKRYLLPAITTTELPLLRYAKMNGPIIFMAW